ncbi:unnamed protein product [Cylicocyclus nassatus]|uniref:Integrase catalytic domain-containing protein n=1 Tax=Cylicocyclus nassatus TaxID=53992 RepID=A0AA36HBJ8_CYLNA|nr:unnamed protein product [Cylicocyclus nassatus]
MPKESEQPTTIAAVQNCPPQEEQLFDLARISKLPIALRMVARVGKYLHRVVAKVNEKRHSPIEIHHVTKFGTNFDITADDIKAAEIVLHADIHKNVDVDELSRKFRNMNIVRDKYGVIRHISRLQHAPIPIDTKSPIFLPSRSEMTRLILIDMHCHNFHCGKDQTLSLARQKYWIPRASGSFKYYLKNCAVCKRWNGLPFGSPQMPSLPTDRVMVTKPFSNVGCDYIGPFCSKNGDNMYIALYTCLVTRAVHLEVVENLSAGAFLNSFIRFVSRRGVPKLVRSDCGTNFRLGSKIIEELSKPCEYEAQSVMSYSATNGIKWLFNPPASPWMGGVWERLVGSVKRCLRKDALTHDTTEEIASRRVLPRSAKTRAYDVIRNFEESLEETQSQSSTNAMQGSQVLPPARNSKVANGSIKTAMLLTVMIAALISPSSAHHATCREGVVKIRERNTL